RSSRQAHPPALAGRTDEVRAGRRAAPSAAGPVPRRADHRARRHHAGYRPRLHPRLQRAIRRDGPAHQPLHGRRRGALPTRPGHRPRTPHLRRFADRVGPARAAGQARPFAALAASGSARSPAARNAGLADRRSSRPAGVANGVAGRRAAGARAAPRGGSHGRGSAARRRDARAVPARGRGGRGMSLRAAAKAYPALLRVGFASAVAYRAEFLIWMFSTNMPLIMLALWAAVARSGPVGTYTQAGFAAYYLCTLLVRLLSGSWVVWELTMEIRQGTLAMRLLRPLHPLLAYSAENLAAVPLRGIVAIPVLSILLWAARQQLGHDAVLWLMLVPAMLGAWLLTFLVMALIGTLPLYVESAASLFEAWLGISSVMLGYLVPLDLFPKAVQQVALVLPFRFLLSFPVELMLGKVARMDALALLGAQWAYVAAALVATNLVWRAGVRRYSAYGG